MQEARHKVPVLQASIDVKYAASANPPTGSRFAVAVKQRKGMGSDHSMSKYSVSF